MKFEKVVVIILGLAVIFVMITIGILIYQDIQIREDKKDFCKSSGGDTIRVPWKGLQCVKVNTMYDIVKLKNGYRLVK